MKPRIPIRSFTILPPARRRHRLLAWTALLVGLAVILFTIIAGTIRLTVWSLQPPTPTRRQTLEHLPPARPLTFHTEPPTYIYANLE